MASSSTSTKRYSIFSFPTGGSSSSSTTPHIPTTKAKDHDDDVTSGSSKTKAYFELVSTTSTGTTSSNNNESSSSSSSMSSDAFWEMIITSYSEMHSDSMSMDMTMSEAMNWFVFGPNPISVNITGMLLLSDTDDYRTKFLYNYVSAYRARQLTANSKQLRFVIEDTSMLIYITAIHLIEDVNNPNYPSISIQGLAYNYKSTNSTESLYTKYYGTTSAVETCKTTTSTEKTTDKDSTESNNNSSSNNNDTSNNEASENNDVTEEKRASS